MNNSTDYLNSTNFSIFIDKINYEISILGLSFLIEFICIYITLKSKKKILKVEFTLLINAFIANFGFKMRFFLKSFGHLKQDLTMDNFFCSTIFVLESSYSIYFFILFYYSMYHLSLLSRSKLCLWLYKNINNCTIMNIYLIIIFICITFTYILIIFFSQNIKIVKDIQICPCYENADYLDNKLILSMSFMIIPALLTLLNYFFCQVVLINRVYFMKKGSKVNQKHNRQKLFVILKFFFIVLYCELNAILSSLNIIVKFFNLKNFSFNFRIIYQFLVYVNLLTSIFLLLIHEKLKQELFIFIKNCFKFIPKIRFK